MSAATEAKRSYVHGTIIGDIEGISPLGGVQSLTGLRIYKVGQGDALAVLDDKGKPILQIDYGGKVSNPFTRMTADRVDNYLPVQDVQLIMLTHWDEDHWCTASKAELIKEERKWLVPRQVTSPRAVEFSTKLDDRVFCIPDERSRETFFFEAANKDHICWEKIAPSKLNAKGEENCNDSGVAFSIVKVVEGGPNKVILAPGDAPFHKVKHYHELLETGTELAGIIAYHHGSKSHWTKETEEMLSSWVSQSPAGINVVFSYGEANSYGHPVMSQYQTMFRAKGIFTRMPQVGGSFVDISFP